MSPDIKVFEPLDIFDANQGLRLQREVTQLLEEETVSAILIDFGGVDFINSSGLGALVALMKKVQAAGSQLYLCTLNAQTKLIFELANMHRLFKIFPNREACEQHLLAREQPDS